MAAMEVLPPTDILTMLSLAPQRIPLLLPKVYLAMAETADEDFADRSAVGAKSRDLNRAGCELVYRVGRHQGSNRQWGCCYARPWSSSLWKWSLFIRTLPIV